MTPCALWPYASKVPSRVGDNGPPDGVGLPRPAQPPRVRALAEEPRAHDALAHLLHEAAAAYTRPDRPHGCLLITAATNCSPQSEDIAAHLRDIRLDGAQTLQAKLAEAVRTGEHPPDTDTRALASFYAAVIRVLIRQPNRSGAHSVEGSTNATL